MLNVSEFGRVMLAILDNSPYLYQITERVVGPRRIQHVRVKQLAR